MLALKVLWRGPFPMFGQSSPLEREEVIGEKKMISSHVSRVESKLSSDIQCYQSKFRSVEECHLSAVLCKHLRTWIRP
jgi:hypothetical protein